MIQETERDNMYLQRIIEHCERLDELRNRFGDCFELFEKDNAYQDAINMNIFQIGEIANHLSEETKNLMNNIPWPQIIGIRNIIAHGYISIEPLTIWNTLISDIPFLQSKIKDFLNK